MTYRYPGGLVRRTAANTSITGASGVWDLGSQAQAVKNNTWPISGLANPVSASLRFRASNSAYLNRTMTTATNNLKWTWSAWVKRGTLGTPNIIFNAGDGSSNNFGAMQFRSEDTLQFAQTNGGAYNVQVYTTAVFRDPSAWYHVVLVYDSPNATSTDRVQIYVNGTRQTALTYLTGPFAQNTASKINSALTHYISKLDYTSLYFDGCMAEVNFIDGQALTPASFGQTSAITGVWEPIKYTGTYGINGFYLSLSDTSSIGKDFSGNGNNWTPNNISTANDSTFDLMRDVPTQWAPQSVTDVGGTVRGNYCTWNPLNKSSNHNSTNGNLTASSSGGTSYGAICATMGVTSGKWYWEMTYTRNGTSNSPVIGFGNDLFTYTNPPFGYLGSDLNGGGINVINGNAAINATSTAYGSAISSGDVVMFAMDLDNRKFYIGKNGTWFNSGNPVSGTNQWPYSATIVGSTFFPAVNMFNDTGDTNFGQRPFAYTPPSGFKSLCTTNLPTPTIGATTTTSANKYFDATTYTGTGATLSVTNAGGFQPDFVWLKSRSAATNHHIYDAVRGATKVLVTNTTEPESTSANTITSFNSGGFTVGTNTAINTSSATYVAWQWNAGGSTVTNTTGSISAQVRANPTAGFSIVTWTGSGSTATIGHGLGVTPKMIIWMHRTNAGAYNHGVYHASLPSAAYALQLTLTLAQSSDNNWWNSTAPTSSVFTVGGYNISDTMVAYCFSEVPGYSAFGSYTGNGSTDGPFVFCGFRPKWIMIKSSSGIEDWRVFDTARSTYNIQGATLYPNTSGAENSGQLIDINSNGFKCRTTDVAVNGSGSTYIYAAFAETPLKYALAR